MKTVSWNVNGVRATQKKGFVEWVLADQADVVCIQETKAQPEQLREEITEIDGYSSYWSKPEKKGYSGVGVLCATSRWRFRQASILDLMQRDAFLS
jgi:exodeoxyribonuclease-3